jgi:hypothetical protein
MRSVDLGGSELWTLIPISLLAGILSAILVRWTGNRRAIRLAVNQILAHVLEFRLFLDEPAVILRAQWDLLRANGRLLRLMLIPGLILLIPSAILLHLLDARFGSGPLKRGEPIVVSARHSVQLAMPTGIVIESPPLRTGEDFSWRIRASVTVPADQLRRANPLLSIPFPPARILNMHWLVWFSLAFSLGAIATKWAL